MSSSTPLPTPSWCLLVVMSLRIKASLLNSSTEQVVVGTATLSPGGGPVGTRHELIVQVSEPWDTQVSRVTLITDSGDRGTETYELRKIQLPLVFT